MKKIGFLIVMALMVCFLAFQPEVKAQQSLTIIGADTLGNTDTDTHYLDLWKIGEFDSLVVSLYAMGEIDIDTLYVNGGVYFQSVPYKGSSVNVTDYTAAKIAGVNISMNYADGTDGETADCFTITKAAVQGYNKLQFKITSNASGNDGLDDYQKYILYYRLYKTVAYIK